MFPSLPWSLYLYTHVCGSFKSALHNGLSCSQFNPLGFQLLSLPPARLPVCEDPGLGTGQPTLPSRVLTRHKSGLNSVLMNPRGSSR